MLTTPVEMMLFAIAGWLNEEQRHKIEFLQEQVRVFQELNGHRRLPFTNDHNTQQRAREKEQGSKSCKTKENENRKWKKRHDSDSE